MYVDNLSTADHQCYVFVSLWGCMKGLCVNDIYMYLWVHRMIFILSSIV